MKLAFNGQGRYSDFSNGYDLYTKRSREGRSVDYSTYKRIVKRYCRLLAERLYEEGMIDLPCGMGSIVPATITRKPQYRGKKFIGYGKMDWDKGHYDGKLKTFGMVYLPRRGKNANLRSFGYVANRRLFKRMKEGYESGTRNWEPIVFNDGMV